MEKSWIFPPLPQQNDDGDDEKKRIANIAVIIEKPAVQKKTSTVTRECRIVYNQAAAGKEWYSKQGQHGYLFMFDKVNATARDMSFWLHLGMN